MNPEFLMECGNILLILEVSQLKWAKGIINFLTGKLPG